MTEPISERTEQPEPELPMVDGRWHGAPGCSKLYFSSPRGEMYESQFQAVWDRLHELARQRDANGWLVVKLEFTRRGPKNQVIAYQWTSEWARAEFEGELVVMGSSLGRGVFQPFGGDPQQRWQFYELIEGDPDSPMLRW